MSNLTNYNFPSNVSNSYGQVNPQTRNGNSLNIIPGTFHPCRSAMGNSTLCKETSLTCFPAQGSNSNAFRNTKQQFQRQLSYTCVPPNYSPQGRRGQFQPPNSVYGGQLQANAFNPQQQFNQYPQTNQFNPNSGGQTNVVSNQPGFPGNNFPQNAPSQFTQNYHQTLLPQPFIPQWQYNPQNAPQPNQFSSTWVGFNPTQSQFRPPPNQFGPNHQNYPPAQDFNYQPPTVDPNLLRQNFALPQDSQGGFGSLPKNFNAVNSKLDPSKTQNTPNPKKNEQEIQGHADKLKDWFKDFYDFEKNQDTEAIQQKINVVLDNISPDLLFDVLQAKIDNDRTFIDFAAEPNNQVFSNALKTKFPMLTEQIDTLITKPSEAKLAFYGIYGKFTPGHRPGPTQSQLKNLQFQPPMGGNTPPQYTSNSNYVPSQPGISQRQYNSNQPGFPGYNFQPSNFQQGGANQNPNGPNQPGGQQGFGNSVYGSPPPFPNQSSFNQGN